MNEFIILDFETTGLSPTYSRIIEVAAVLVKDDQIIDSFATLMNPGQSIPRFITDITGITNSMVRGKPSPEAIMPDLFNFIGDRTILAHNATFDQKFLLAEMAMIGKIIKNPFLCTLKLARRLICAPNYKLTTLTSHLQLKRTETHQAHRALDDVKVTLELWLHMKKQVTMTLNKAPDFPLFQKITNQPKSKTTKLLQSETIS